MALSSFIANCFAERFIVPEMTVGDRVGLRFSSSSMTNYRNILACCSWTIRQFSISYFLWMGVTSHSPWLQNPIDGKGLLGINSRWKNIYGGWSSTSVFERVRTDWPFFIPYSLCTKFPFRTKPTAEKKDSLHSDSNPSEDEQRTLVSVFLMGFLKDPFLFLQLNGTTVDVKTPSSKYRQTRIFWHALFRTYSDKILVGGLLKFMSDVCQFSGPLLLK